MWRGRSVVRKKVANSYYASVLSAVKFRQAGVQSDLVGHLKGSPKPKEIAQVAACATFDGSMRQQCTSLNLDYAAHQHLYCAIMGGLILYEDPNMLQFHDDFFNDGPDSRKVALATLKFGSIRGPRSVREMRALVEKYPLQALNGVANDLVHWWVDLKVSRNVLPLLFRLMRLGHYPGDVKPLSRLVGAHTLSFTRALGNQPPKIMVHLAIKLAGQVPKNQEQVLDHLTENMDDKAWALAFQRLHYVPWTKIYDLMETVNHEPNKETLTQVTLRQRTIEGCQTMIEKFKARRWTVPPKVYGYLLNLTRRYERTKFECGGAIKLYQSMKDQVPSKHLATGLMNALMKRNHTQPILRFHDQLKRTGEDCEETWNYALYALIKRRRIPEALKHISVMAERRYRFHSTALSDLVIHLIEYGRVPPCTTRGENEQYQLKHIFALINKLSKQGFVFPPRRNTLLIQRLGPLHGYSMARIEQIIEIILKKQLKHIRATDTEQALVDYWRDMDQASMATLLTYKDVLAIVDIAVRKKPRIPWRAAHFLMRLRKKGVHVPGEWVSQAHEQVLAKLYDQTQAKGEYARVRQQMDPYMSIDTVIQNVNKAWNDQLYGKRKRTGKRSKTQATYKIATS